MDALLADDDTKLADTDTNGAALDTRSVTLRKRAKRLIRSAHTSVVQAFTQHILVSRSPPASSAHRFGPTVRPSGEIVSATEKRIFSIRMGNDQAATMATQPTELRLSASELKELERAYTGVCRVLGLGQGHDDLQRRARVAELIVEFARTGEINADKMQRRAVALLSGLSLIGWSDPLCEKSALMLNKRRRKRRRTTATAAAPRSAKP